MAKRGSITNGRSRSTEAVQPHVVGSDTILLPTGMNMGTRALRIKKSNGQYAAEELWTSRQLKPDFVDLVTYQGSRLRKRRRYSHLHRLANWRAQMERRPLRQRPDPAPGKFRTVAHFVRTGASRPGRRRSAEHRELASFQALDGKTWNHPVLVGDRLYVRNSQEAAAYRMQ